MLSSLKSLVTTPLSWFANVTNDSFETDDTHGKRKLVHSAANSYDDEGDEQDAPSAYRVKRIRLDSPERVATLPTAPTSYLDPPTPSLRPSAHPRSHASKPARPYAPSYNSIPIPRLDTSRLSPISFNPPPRAQAVPGARTMSMDPPTARRTSAQEPTFLPPPISRDVSMENSPNPSTQPAHPAFRMRSSLTPQPGAPLYGPNPQRRERNPSEPPPLTALIENPIFVKPPSVSQDNRRVMDGPSSLTLGSLVDTQKSQNPSANRSHSVLVLRPQVTNSLRPTNAAEIALQELERYRTPLVPTHLGSANIDVALPGLFQARKKARALVLMKRDKRDDKPRLGHASKYINSSKEKDKDTPSKNKNSKPYAGEGGLKKLLARRKQEVIEAESVDAQVMIDDDGLGLERPKRTSRIAEPVRSPATFARKVSAPPPSSFVSMSGRIPAHGRTSRARTVGPTRTRNRFTAVYDDDEPDGADDLTIMPEEPSKEKECVNASHPKFEPPCGFSFAPPPSVTSIPQAPDTSTQDEPPISALPFTFSKTPMPTVTIPAPTIVTPAPQPPAIALVPPTPEGPQMDKSVSERISLDFRSTSQTSAHTGVPPRQTDSNSTSKAEPKLVSQVDEPTEVSKSETGATGPESLVSHTPIPPAETLETQGSSLAPFNFGPSPPILPTPTLTSSAQPATTSLPFSLTPSSTEHPSEKKDDTGVVPPKPLFGGVTSSFPGFGTPASASAPSTKLVTQATEASTSLFPFPKVTKPATAESVEPLKPGFTLASSPSLMPVSVSEALTEAAKPRKLSTPFSFDQPAKESTTTAPSTPAKTVFTFGASSTTPSTAEKPAVTSTGLTFGSSTTTPANAHTGLSFGSPVTQSKSAASTGGFSFGKPASADVTKSAFSFGVTTVVRSLTPPPADDGMRMEESPTRGGGMDVNGGSAKPQSLPQLQMPGSSKPGLSFGASTGTGFGSPLPSPFGGNSGSGFTIGQQNQPSSQGASGGFTFGTNKKASESVNGGFSFPATKAAENVIPTAPTFGQPAADAKPSPSTGFSFGQQGPKTADASSSGFSFKAPEPIQHSASFTFGQTLPEPTRPSSAAGFAFGTAPPQQPTTNTNTSFTFNSPASGGAFGSAPASPAFGTQSLAATSSTPFSFAGPTSAPPQHPAPNPFGFGSGAGQPTSPAVQQGFTFNYGGTPSTPTGQFGTPAPQMQTPSSAGSAIFTMGTPAAPPSGQRAVKKLPTRRNANARR